ncbi:hypothetical protein [Micromonospora craterilacus]|uniref:hypothetical protein n=1 Tax=Micromonospora craterilacus TaxID=1655439 RepID=UPI001F468475|nr:hypothetical protein [Micromonospora craterilacus]
MSLPGQFHPTKPTTTKGPVRMPLRLWFDLATVLDLAATAIAAAYRIDIDGHVGAHVPPALHLMRDSGDLDDSLYIDGNFRPSLAADNINAAPFRSTYGGRRFGHGITWTEWLGGPLRPRSPIQAQIALVDGARLIDLLRAGRAAGCDMFTVDADSDPRPGVARRRHRAERSPQAGASHHARPAQGPPYTSSRRKRPGTVVDRSFDISNSSHYTLTRVHHIDGHVIRVRVRRDYRTYQSSAVAEVLTPALTWTVLARDPMTACHPGTRWSTVKTENVLAAVADKLVARARTILAGLTRTAG